MRKRHFLFIFLVFAFVLTACVKSGSGEDSWPTETLPFVLDGDGTQSSPGMETIESNYDMFASQTAQADMGIGGPVTTGDPTPTPTSQFTSVPETPPASVTPIAGGSGACSSPYIVLPGDWVYSIARKCGVDPQAIIDANNLAPPYLIQPGQSLIIPNASQSTTTVPPTGTTSCASPYTVQTGEWVYSIARKCGVTPEALIAANNMVYPYVLYPGDQLIIP